MAEVPVAEVPVAEVPVAEVPVGGDPGSRRRGRPFRPLILTSNKAFTEWGSAFADDVLATAILDRLLHHCHVISINGPSYRLKDRMSLAPNTNSVP